MHVRTNTSQKKAKGLSILRDMEPKHLSAKEKNKMKSGDDPQTYFSAILLLQLVYKNNFEKDISYATYDLLTTLINGHCTILYLLQIHHLF